jgi:Flp pilus assembly protein TadB
MDSNKQLQEASLIGRFLSMEALLMLMGVASLLYGIINSSLPHICWGLVIIPGILLLVKVRRDRRRKKNNHQ